jgi:hypothetical protein
MAREEKVIIDFEIDAQESIETIDSLTAANKKLREERKKVNIQSEEGKKQIAQINAQLDQNNQKIKENVSALEKQKINIGNYKSALDGVHPVLGQVGEGLEAGASGFKAMARQALAFIATPIGAILAALVAVFSLLKTALSQNDELMDKFENVTNAVGVVIELVTARIGKLGEALIALATGNYVEAIKLTSEAFSGLGDEIENAVKQQTLFLEASRNLEDSMRALNIQTAKQENVIKSLVVAAKNRNLTFDQQESLLVRALNLEKDLVDTRQDLARQDLLITARRLRADKEFQQQSNENFDQYIQRLLDSSKLGDDEKNKIAEKIVALENARGSSLAFQEKVANSLAAIDEKRAAAAEKAAAAAKAAAETQAFIEGVARRNANRQEEDPQSKIITRQINLNKDYTSEMQKELAARAKITDKYWEDRNKKAKEASDKEIQIERGKYQIFSNLLGAAQGLVAEDSAAHKIFATGQALINTYLAATAALASGSEINPIFGLLSAAAAVASGLASVAKINGVEFAEGGWTGPGHKYKAVGVVHADEYVVPKRIVNSSAGQHHIAALEGMRRGYADGGLVTNTNSQQVNTQLALANIIKNMPPMEVSVKEVTKVQKRIKVKESISKR